MVLASMVLVACGGGRSSDGSAADTGTTVESVSERVDRLLSEQGDTETGAEVYASGCASCHDANGYGGIGPMLVGTYLELDDVLTTVIAGQGDMPPAGLDDGDLVDLMAHLEADVLYEDLCRSAAYRCD